MSRSPKGFSLVEILVALGIVAVLSALVIPLVARNAEASRIKATAKELQGILEAIRGDPRKETFGYVGDLGRVPQGLDSLIHRGTQPAFTTNTTGGVGMGWNGPYLKVSDEEEANGLRDAWGTPYQYLTTEEDTETPENPFEFEVRILSAGPDKEFGTADDIRVPPDEDISAGGTILVNVFVREILNSPGTQVEVFSTSGGQEVVQSQTVPAIGTPFPGFFFRVHQGVHAIRASRVGLTRTTLVTVPANGSVRKDITLFGPTTEGVPQDFGPFQSPSGNMINATLFCLTEMIPSLQTLANGGNTGAQTIINDINTANSRAADLAAAIAANSGINAAAVALENAARQIRQDNTGGVISNNELRGSIDRCAQDLENAADEIDDATS